ncbi:MAG TPA: TadE/TadG family type IV pilus assembly protein [Candidatus Dormibacteraeota bacterium]|nr:TadE/TadG family type IV pilus assembly protein [Candidatus Dormibacteraeota bacterium]
MTIIQRMAVRRLVRETRGAEIAEAAAVLPIMFMMLLGIFWFGQAFSIYGALTRAAQDGARAGSLPYCATCNGNNTLSAYATNAANAVQNDLLASKLNPSLAQYPSPQPSLISCSTSASVTCSAGASTQFCIQAPIQLTNTGLGATGLCGISVSMRYPYRFWLPFTSINQQTIWISASARVKMETR